MAVSGLKIQNIPAGAVGFTFSPSVGIVARNIDKLGADIRSFHEPLLESIRKVMIPSFQKNFAEGGRPTPWEPLAEYTIERREEEGARGGILVRKGTLLRVMGQINIWTVTPTFVAIKSLPKHVWYGYLHQAGMGSFVGSASQKDIEAGGKGINTGAKRVHIPQRQFVLFQDQDVDDIEEVFADWLEERVQGAVRVL